GGEVARRRALSMDAYARRAVLPVARAELAQRRVEARPPADERIAAPRHVEAVAAVARDRLHETDAVIGEGGHRRMRPPVAIVLARRRRGEAHRRQRIEQHDAA